MPKQLSRQRKWQLKNIAAGLCAQCSNPLNHYTVHCDPCAKLIRARTRKAKGLKAWRKGGYGRPPIVP